jgi:hypothetical protein
MKSLCLGAFHNVAGVKMGENGISIWDYHDMEYFLEIRSRLDQVPITGEFGTPLEEGGFTLLEGMRIPGVKRVSITHYDNFADYEVRTMNIVTGDLKLYWDLFLPHKS